MLAAMKSLVNNMATQLRYDGRVVVVTGAGGGLGKAYALLFAERGASVVVNDLGGGRSGEGQSTSAADKVVSEIKSKGGKAVADYNSVVDGDKIVRTALENYGRIDVVVNNAGILRDKSFPRISEEDWNLIFDVHVKGSFKTTQAAWPHFKKQNYGRIIMTSSTAGIYGNFGQANYSAAKMALVGLSNTLAIEGTKYNIHSNVIAPTAASRLTEDILPPDLFAELKPELIAPVVVWLCHESCQDNGAIIDSGAGWAAKSHIVRGQGSLLREKITDGVTLEAVQNNWGPVTDMSNAQHISSIQEYSVSLMNCLEVLKDPAKNEQSNTSGKAVFNYTNRDCIIYAFGIGASLKNKDELKYLYESHSDFSAFPTFAIVPGMIAVMNSDAISNALPSKSIDFTKVLHGEQFLELFKPFPTGGKLTTTFNVVDVLDKKKGAVVICDFDTYDENGEQISHGQTQAFIVGAGNFNGKRSSDKGVPTVEPPRRKPDVTVIDKTSHDQAGLYRLSGDLNPLHIDEQFAALGGFSEPILHGLSSLGVATRQVLRQWGGNNPENFKSIKIRFSRPVIPGQSIKTDMWREGNRIHFRSSVAETGDVILSGAYIDLKQVIAANVPVQSLTSAEGPSSDAIFQALKDQISSNIEKAKQVNGVFFYIITKSGNPISKWTLDLKKGDAYKGDPPSGVKIDATITVDDQDIVDIVTGKLNAQGAFMTGKLKIKGNIMLVQKLQGLMTQAKL